MKERYCHITEEKPLISVLVSLYNYRKYITRALDSVYNQTFRQIELLVCDDCSTDDGPELASKWLQEHEDRFCRVLLFSNDCNSKLCKTRNALIAQAAAPYVFILDADNYIFPACLQRSFDVLHDAPADVAFVYAQRLVFQEKNPQKCILENLQDWDITDLAYWNYIDMMVLHRIAALHAVSCFTDEEPFNSFGLEDYDLWLKYAEAGLRGIKIHQPLVAYSKHARSAIRSSAHTKNQIWLRNAIRKHHPELFDPYILLMPDREYVFIQPWENIS